MRATAAGASGTGRVAARRVLRLAVIGLVLAASASCDRGGAFVVDNQLDQEVVVRVSGLMAQPSPAPVRYEPRQDALLVPAHSRLAVAVLQFADPFSIRKVEVLTGDCRSIGVFDEATGVAFARDGSVILIQPGPAARLVDEYPESGTPAQPTDRCPE